MRIKYFFTHHRSNIASASLILAATSLLSRLLGLFRDRLLAGRFGTGSLIDGYQISFLLPDLVYNLFIVGALSVAFIPVFLKIYHKNKTEAWDLANRLLNSLGLFIVAIVIICFIFTPQIVNLLGRISEVSGTHYDRENLNLIVKLTRLMLISPLLLGLSALSTGILQSLKHFLTPALSPVFYNIGIILGILILSPFWNIYGVAVGVIIGAFLHGIIQLPCLLSAGFKYRPTIKLTESAKRVIKLAIPRTFGLVALQASFWINKIIAFTIGVGAVSVYYFANNLQFLPIGLFGTSIAIATFPNLAQANNRKKSKKFVQTFSKAFCYIIYLTVPISVIFLLLRAQIVRIVLGTGEFGWPATIATARTLGFFAISIFAQSLILLLARAFYALHNTKIPVIISIASLIVNVILALILSKTLGVAGLSLAYSCASFLNMFALLIILRLKFSDLNDSYIIKCILKVIVASAISGLAVYNALYLIAPLVDMQRFWGVFVQAAGAFLVGISFYLFLTILLRCPETKLIFEKIRQRISKRS